MKKWIFASLLALLAIVPVHAQIAPPIVSTMSPLLGLTERQVDTFLLLPMPEAMPQITNPCGGTQIHCVTLNWGASPSQAGCTSTGTPPCAFVYDVMESGTSGQEGTPPAATPTGTTAALTYVYPVTLGANPTTYFFTVIAQETVTEANGTVIAVSNPSNEASGSFPGQPGAATTATATTH